jgi:hypothetical protein
LVCNCLQAANREAVHKAPGLRRAGAKKCAVHETDRPAHVNGTRVENETSDYVETSGPNDQPIVSVHKLTGKGSYGKGKLRAFRCLLLPTDEHHVGKSEWIQISRLCFCAH